jgi:hypothetical protein
VESDATVLPPGQLQAGLDSRWFDVRGNGDASKADAVKVQRRLAVARPDQDGDGAVAAFGRHGDAHRLPAAVTLSSAQAARSLAVPGLDPPGLESVLETRGRKQFLAEVDFLGWRLGPRQFQRRWPAC